MSPERELPAIDHMPVVGPEVVQTIQTEIRDGGETAYWKMGASLVEENPEHRGDYEAALRQGPSEVPDATSASVLLVHHALDLQAKMDGFQLPKIPVFNPSPALSRFWHRTDGTELAVINLAYDELIRGNPLIGEILDEIVSGAPDELLRIATQEQAKRGAVYAYYSVKSFLPTDSPRDSGI